MGSGITDQSGTRYWWGVTLCPPELNDVALAETVVIMMRLAAIREIHLNGEVNKPSLAQVLECQGLRMECSAESTPHEEACIYSSAYDGGKLLTELEETGREMTEGEENDEIPTRSQGEYATTTNPWPRDEGKEAKAVAEMHKRKPCPTRRQGNRWDQYGESSSAASSEAHGMSDSTYTESRARGSLSAKHSEQLSPTDSKRPVRVMASGPDGLVTLDSHSLNSGVIALRSGYRQPATTVHGRGASEWEGSQWSIPTKWTLKGSDYDIDREWHSRNLKYGEGWAYDSSRSHYKRAKPTGTDPEDDRKEDSALPIGSTSKTYDPQN